MCKWNITEFILTYPHPPNCNNHKHTWKVIQREFMTKQIHRVQSKLFQKYVKGIIQLNTCTCVVFISFTCLEAIPLFNNKVKFKCTCTCMPLNNDWFFFISKYIIFINILCQKGWNTSSGSGVWSWSTMKQLSSQRTAGIPGSCVSSSELCRKEFKC